MISVESARAAVPEKTPQLCQPSRRVDKPHSSWWEPVIVGLLILAGIAAIAFRQRASDFLGEDVFYADAARSLLAHGMYGINGRPETNQPPGLSAMLALLFALGGYNRAICLSAIALTESLGFVLAYKLLRRHESVQVSACISILLVSSPICFQMATQTVFPCFPFLLTSVLALWAAENYEATEDGKRKAFWFITLAAAVVFSLMIATAEIALLGAMLVASAASFIRNRQLGKLRFRRFLPVIVIGLAVLGLWMARKPAPLEWPEVPGYPAPYVQQLKVKRGNYPEAGMATWQDIPARIGTNVSAQADLFAQLILRHGVNRSKIAVTIVPILLTTLGCTYSIIQTSGQQLLDWYFLGYEFIYLLWPWDLEPRFFLPVVPFACFYAWKGLKAAAILIRTKPRAVGAIWFPVGMVLAFFGSQWIYLHWNIGLGDWPDELLVPLWFLSAVVAGRMALGRDKSPLIARMHAYLNRKCEAFRITPLRVAHSFIAVLFLMLLGIGIYGEVEVARQNIRYPDISLTRDTSLNPMASEIEAAEWVRSNTPSDSVVMARHVPTVYHYADRKVVWFAPSSNADVLERGIARLGVNYIIVIKHNVPYYLPDDDYCFASLQNKYQSTLQLVFKDSELSIFKVKHPSTTSVSDRSRHAEKTHHSA